jgi:serine/threonine protein kinase
MYVYSIVHGIFDYAANIDASFLFHKLTSAMRTPSIFLMSDGKSVKVGDFGISKVLDTAVGKDQMAAPDVEGRVGTKRYMAPEVLNRQEYSNKADIWSLGCVLFELTTLNHPTYEQERRIYFEWIPSVYSQNMQNIIQACLSERASARPSPRELLVKLAAPMIQHPGVQQEFMNAMIWFDQQLMNKHRQFEAQAAVVRQFLPQTQRITPPPAIAPRETPAPVPAAAPMPAPMQPEQVQQPSSQGPKQAPPGGWSDPTAENFPGTGIVLSIDSQGTISVAGLVQGSTAEQSKMVDVGDILHEVDSHNVFRRFTSLPADVLSGPVGTSVRVGLQKTHDPRRLTHIVLARRLPTGVAHVDQLTVSAPPTNQQPPAPPPPPPPQQQQQQQQQQVSSVTSPTPPERSATAFVAPVPETKGVPVHPVHPPPRSSTQVMGAATITPAPDGELEHFNIPEYNDDADVASPNPGHDASSQQPNSVLSGASTTSHERTSSVGSGMQAPASLAQGSSLPTPDTAQEQGRMQGMMQAAAQVQPSSAPSMGGSAMHQLAQQQPQSQFPPSPAKPMAPPLQQV